MMKQFSIFLFLIAIAALISCKKAGSNPQQASTQQANAVTSEQSAHSQSSPRAPVEIRYFRGSIGSALGLQMKLVREGEKLTGSYFYQKSGARIDLKGSIDKDNYIALEEFDTNGKQTGVFKGLWTMNQEEGMVNIAGNWTRPDGQKKTAFSLHEEPIHFSGAAEIISKTIKESNKKLRYEIDGEYPQLVGLLSLGFEKFNQEASRLTLREVNGFRKDMSEASSETSESSSGSTLDIGYTVALATDDLISIQFDVGTYYSGAAHPNSNSRVLNFDVKKVRTLKLGDLFKPGAKYLQILSSYSVKDLKRQSNANGADGMLDDASIESGAGATAGNYENWTISKKGLGIIFDAYQVGPYAAGPQYVLVPYSALKEIIDPTGPLGMYLK